MAELTKGTKAYDKTSRNNQKGNSLVKRIVGRYTAVGGETTLNTVTQLSNAITFIPNLNQIDVYSAFKLYNGVQYTEMAGNILSFAVALTVGEVIEVVKTMETTSDVLVLDTLGLSTYTVSATLNQASVVCPWSFPINANSIGKQGAIRVTVDGSLYSRNTNNYQGGSGMYADGDYYELQISGSTYATTIMFNDPTLILAGMDITIEPQFFYNGSQALNSIALDRHNAYYDIIVGDTTGCDTASLQTALNSGNNKRILLVKDVTTTGLTIPASATNIQIFGYGHKITKSGTSSNSRAILLNSGTNRIYVKGIEFVNWDDTGDYLFYAADATVNYINIQDCIQGTYTNNHNLGVFVVNYVYNGNM